MLTYGLISSGSEGGICILAFYFFCMIAGDNLISFIILNILVHQIVQAGFACYIHYLYSAYVYAIDLKGSNSYILKRCMNLSHCHVEKQIIAAS